MSYARLATTSISRVAVFIAQGVELVDQFGHPLPNLLLHLPRTVDIFEHCTVGRVEFELGFVIADKAFGLGHAQANAAEKLILGVLVEF